jgi:XTP/dITP diphosphohydrolase
MTLYIATSNPGKLRDFAHAAAAFPGITIAPLPNLDSIPPPEETADTFAGNALIKALAYSKLAPGEIVLADDSGISVRGLGGAPGVRSARYADDQHFPGEGTTDQRNLACLAQYAPKLRYRDVSYICALAAVRDGELIATGTGELQGQLREEPRGTGGFGYDPIFEVLELAQTMAEVDDDTRLRISHRGRALVRLLKNLDHKRSHPHRPIAQPPR